MAIELDTDRGVVRVPTAIWKVDPAHSSVVADTAAVCSSPYGGAAA
jgi:hypothetical protein